MMRSIRLPRPVSVGELDASDSAQALADVERLTQRGKDITAQVMQRLCILVRKTPRLIKGFLLDSSGEYLAYEQSMIADRDFVHHRTLEPAETLLDERRICLLRLGQGEADRSELVIHVAP